MLQAGTEQHQKLTLHGLPVLWISNLAGRKGHMTNVGQESQIDTTAHDTTAHDMTARDMTARDITAHGLSDYGKPHDFMFIATA
ncbi:MAG: hypothetical protein EBV87_01770 [Alphaproteobacteria bacterium]|nr:hypothetical protein [Alphaproteobacteria bacterium]